MAIEARIIRDSISTVGVRLTTVQYRAPRCILAEAKTHRLLARGTGELLVFAEDISVNADDALSRNARSSRAVPTKKLLEEVAEDPFIPVRWGRNQPGMQAEEELTPEEITAATKAWLTARDAVIEQAETLRALGVHKEHVNRMLEPWMWVDGVISATEWANFFALRIHPDAEPHMRMLAESIHAAMAASEPAVLEQDQWHLPYVLPEEERSGWSIEDLQFISAARCARVSYRPFDADRIDVAKDLARGRDLVGHRPMHASPMEHIGTPDPTGAFQADWGNFRGWRQFRRMLVGHEATG